MEYIPGGTLRDLLDKNTYLSISGSNGHHKKSWGGLNLRS